MNFETPLAVDMRYEFKKLYPSPGTKVMQSLTTRLLCLRQVWTEATRIWSSSTIFTASCPCWKKDLGQIGSIEIKEVRERKKSGQDGKERINQEKNPQDLSVFTHIASLPASQRLFLEREHSALACNEQWESHHHATFLVGTRACWTDVISSM